MAIKFYKKTSPRTTVKFGNFALTFPTFDNIVGYYSTDNAAVQAALADYIANQQYGLTEISQEEYNADYLEKKNNGATLPPRQYREEITSRGFSSGQHQGAYSGDTRVAAVVRTGNGSIAPKSETQMTIAESSEADSIAQPKPAVSPTAQPLPAGQFQPSTGKRK
jgi:hypothetical protein